MAERERHSNAVPAAMLGVVVLGLVVTGWSPKDRFTWVMEVAPIGIGFPVLIATYARFRFTTLVYVLLAVHAWILMIGGHWTYAEVPLGFWMERAFGFTRNHYDRIGHFAQGFVPALIGRELLLRTSPLKGSRWLPFLVFTACMTISVTYEFVEWWTALASGAASDAFLGTQGDPWDTQEDMFMCAIGATTALLTMTRVHDRALARLGV